MRKNVDFVENFSIGLTYKPRDIRGEIALLRCNGPHGPHVMFDHHNRFHIHKADQENLASGIRAERTAYITNKYASFQDALGYFIKKCNIIDAEKYFVGVLQHELFFKSNMNWSAKMPLLSLFIIISIIGIVILLSGTTITRNRVVVRWWLNP